MKAQIYYVRDKLRGVIVEHAFAVPPDFVDLVAGKIPVSGSLVFVPGKWPQIVPGILHLPDTDPVVFDECPPPAPTAPENDGGIQPVRIRMTANVRNP